MLNGLVDKNVGMVISTGFCGALDPALRVGEIVRDGIWTEDRVGVTAEDKRRLRQQTGARVVEMEFAAVSAKAAEWGVPCKAIRVVSDTALEDLPLDFNRYRDGDGRCLGHTAAPPLTTVSSSINFRNFWQKNQTGDFVC